MIMTEEEMDEQLEYYEKEELDNLKEVLRLYGNKENLDFSNLTDFEKENLDRILESISKFNKNEYHLEIKPIVDGTAYEVNTGSILVGTITNETKNKLNDIYDNYINNGYIEENNSKYSIQDIKRIITWFNDNRTGLFNSLSNNDWEYLDKVNNFLGWHDIENVKVDSKEIEFTILNGQTFNDSVAIPTSILEKLRALSNDQEIKEIIEFFRKNKDIRLKEIFKREKVDYSNVDKILKYLDLYNIKDYDLKVVNCDGIEINDILIGNLPFNTLELLLRIKNNYEKGLKVIAEIEETKEELENNRNGIYKNAVAVNEYTLENKKSLLSQEEIDAVVVLVKAGKINFDNINRILSQEEINSISEILNDSKVIRKK